RDQVASEVKELDQDARGALRKHGVRFGQFTVFMPALLKPAPTRLRLLLWSLSKGLPEFPEAPPPGLVTIPVVDVHEGAYTMSGYHRAGARAIRIDMLERLADLLRAQDSRGGFEANPDMLSITGMTLDQFADLMQGLGYKAEKGEREKVKAAHSVVAGNPPSETPPEPPVEDPEKSPEETPPAPPAETPVEEPGEVPSSPPVEMPGDMPLEVPQQTADCAAPAEDGPIIEPFYTFTWVGNRPSRREGGERARGPARAAGKPQDRGQDRHRGKPKGKRPPRDDKAKNFSARPPRQEKIDPDNPFAALLALKDKS
ncbi:MAG: disulfide oxidoreductase, partial [Paracoccaceae bacterium]